MTSTSSRARAHVSVERVGERGFTMVELLITIAIIAFLLGGLMTVGMGLRSRARIEKSQAMVQMLELHLDQYKGKAGGYPEDGLDDKKVYTEEGTQLMSGAALTYALTQPIVKKRKMPDGTMKAAGTAAAVAQFTADQLVDYSAYGFQLDDPEAAEACDAWNGPIHYDRLIGGRDAFSRQDTSEVHTAWEEIGYGDVDDPRTDPGEGISCRIPGPQNLGEFDLWSHGPFGHDRIDDLDKRLSETICNWTAPGLASKDED